MFLTLLFAGCFYLTRSFLNIKMYTSWYSNSYARKYTFNTLKTVDTNEKPELFNHNYHLFNFINDKINYQLYLVDS